MDGMKYYNPPTIKIAITPIFRLLCIFTCHIMMIGRDRMKMSVAEFMTAENVQILDTSMHDP